LLTETVVRCFAGEDFTSQELMCNRSPVTVYLRWPERDLLALSPLVRLLWGSLIDELITTYDTLQGDNCREVLLLIDEAGRTAIPSLSDHATTVVGRGVSLRIAIQSLSQLDAVYGKPRAPCFATTWRAKFIIVHPTRKPQTMSKITSFVEVTVSKYHLSISVSYLDIYVAF
jgi:type IV secretory pathway TraG/TraD family ATPase VirD4